MKLREKIEEALEKEKPNAMEDPALPVSFKGKERVEIEFYCQNCDHYVYFHLNINLEGNHIIVCPNCSHKHYRLVVNGIITSDRFNQNYCIVDEIIPLESAAVPSSQRRKRGTVALLREMEACGVLE